MDKNDFLSIISKALELSPTSVITLESTRNDIPEWDSLGNLAILSALDEVLNGALNNVKGVSKAQTLGQLYQALSEAKKS